MSASSSAKSAGESAGTAGNGLVTTSYALRWGVLAVVLAAQCMDLMDSTIVDVFGPSIRRDLGGAASTLQWFSAAYTLAFAVLLVTGARLGDIFGRRPLFLVGSAGFTITSAACALTTSPSMLIAFRAIEGEFGALLIPQGFGMLKEVLPEEEMSTVLSALGSLRRQIGVVFEDSFLFSDSVPANVAYITPLLDEAVDRLKPSTPRCSRQEGHHAS